MHNYGIPPEMVRLVLALGIIVSMLIYERFRLTGGAAVVAGYLGIFVSRPLYIITTLTIAMVTFFVVQRFIARRMFLYGRRRLVVMVMVGMVFEFIAGTTAYFASPNVAWLIGLYGVGFVLPGLIAQDMERQGVWRTTLTTLVTAIITYLLMENVLAIKSNLPIYWNSIAFEDKTILYSYHTQLLVPAVVLSVIVSAVLFEWMNIRSGGFLTAAYAALFVLKPIHLVFITLVGILVYFTVTHLLMRYTPIFGRTKFAMMVLTGLVFTWGLEVLTAQVTHNAFIPFAGFSIISPMIAALIANDGERQGLQKTFIGVTATTFIVFIAIKGVDLLVLA